MLVGREAECGRLDRLLAEARGGRSGAVVVRGDAGTGKTALCDYAVAAAGGMKILRARGVESEHELAFSGLSELFHAVLDRLDAIPPPQAAALAGALALAPPVTRDRFTICAATLSLLAAAAEDAPVVAVVDDAHFLDDSSAESLVFAARRLDAEGVALVVALRDNGETPFTRAGLAEIAVGGLGADAVRGLLERASETFVADNVAERLRLATSGNPLALRELASVLSKAELAGEEPLRTQLVSGHSVERPFVRRVTELPAAAQRALVVVAAGESLERSTIVRALENVGIDAQALGLLEARGVVAVESDRVRFRHPLLRSWIYHGASTSERRSAHRALAKVSGGREPPDRRAWHLAVAAPAMDADVASTLEETARNASRRGAPAEAASAFERAARLSIDNLERARRLREAANAYRLAGQVERALEVIDEALGLSEDPLFRADLQHVRGRAEMWRGARAGAHDVLVDEAERIVAVDPRKAAVMLVDAVMIALTRGDIHVALATAKRARGTGERAGGAVDVLTQVALETVRVIRGEPEGAVPLAALAEAVLDETDADLPAHQLILFAGQALTWVEEYETARRLLENLIDRARSASAPAELPFALACLADLDFRTGRWPAAYAGATESMRLAGDTRQTGVLAYSLLAAARIEAAQGRDHECRGHVARALEAALAAGTASAALFSHSTLGLLELGLGEAKEAATELERAAGIAAELGVGEPTVAQWGADLVEAYTRAGRTDDAVRALETFTAQAERTGRAWAHAAAARCRGLLAEDNFDDAFATALEWHERTPTPFERARTELVLGERLRRAKRRSDARQWLRGALEMFERLGAVTWADRARTELHATGETLRRRHDIGLEQLTPQELQVALLVAEGATNREVGAALFLSPKTIERHLSHTYRKLNVRSRTELARVVASETSPVRAAAM